MPATLNITPVDPSDTRDTAPPTAILISANEGNENRPTEEAEIGQLRKYKKIFVSLQLRINNLSKWKY